MTIMQPASLPARVRAFFSRHRKLRIALIIVLVLALLLLLFHPKGTKTYLILGIDNYGSLDVNGRSDVMMLVQIDFARTNESEQYQIPPYLLDVPQEFLTMK